MTENNKMAEVAAIFGKKLDEGFAVKDEYQALFCKFTEQGLLTLDITFRVWRKDGNLLQLLLTGEKEILDN